MKHHVTKGSVFDDLGLDAAKATNMKIRAALMRAVEEELDKKYDSAASSEAIRSFTTTH